MAHGGRFGFGGFAEALASGREGRAEARLESGRQRFQERELGLKERQFESDLAKEFKDEINLIEENFRGTIDILAEVLRGGGSLEERPGLNTLVQSQIATVSKIDPVRGQRMANQYAALQRTPSTVGRESATAGQALATIRFGEAGALALGGVPVSAALETAGITLPKPGETATQTATLALNLLKNNIDPQAIRNILTQAATEATDERDILAIQSIANALPETLADFERAKTQADLAGKQPIIDKLVELGVPEAQAAAIVLGRAGTQIAIGPTLLSPADMSRLRARVEEIDSAIINVESVIPLINDETIGLVAAINESLGPTQQIAGVKQVVNLVGGVVGLAGEEAIRNAIVARAAFRQVIGPLARFITDKGGRLSNEDRLFAIEATALLNIAADKEAALEIVSRMVRLAKEVRAFVMEELKSGRIPEAPPGAISGPRELTVTREGTGFVVRDAQGKIVNRFEAQQ